MYPCTRTSHSCIARGAAESPTELAGTGSRWRAAAANHSSSCSPPAPPLLLASADSRSWVDASGTAARTPGGTPATQSCAWHGHHRTQHRRVTPSREAHPWPPRDVSGGRRSRQSNKHTNKYLTFRKLAIDPKTSGTECQMSARPSPSMSAAYARYDVGMNWHWPAATMAGDQSRKPRMSRHTARASGAARSTRRALRRTTSALARRA